MATPFFPLEGLKALPSTLGDLRFLERNSIYAKEKPYHFSGPMPPDEEPYRTNLLLQRHQNIPIFDLRGHAQLPNLETHGFQFANHETKMFDTDSPHATLEGYMTEMANFVQDLLKAEAVICFDYRFRKRQPSNLANNETDGSSVSNPNQPAWQVHTGLRRARRHLTDEEAGKFLDGTWRIRLVNLWRPLYHPVEDAPLAFCDYRSIDPKDLVATDRPSREYVGEVYYVHYNANQRWYWLSTQTPSEVTLFLSYDSHPKSGKADVCPHSAFLCNEGQPGLRPRESVELRFIVITMNDIDETD